MKPFPVWTVEVMTPNDTHITSIFHTEAEADDRIGLWANIAGVWHVATCIRYDPWYAAISAVLCERPCTDDTEQFPEGRPISAWCVESHSVNTLRKAKHRKCKACVAFVRGATPEVK